ncbi:Protein of unknown function (DUF559)/Domain of unknown function (DUF4095) [Frankia torreyi]|uniref:DUF559 domain-containing protein n=1 Tax=Frankia torreyi TaxID=1856 RepID=A0A0D8BIW0_9ACTN|nr:MULTISPECIES: DUF559 domain-containing protein [Frankia]KJE23939.1 Protein of unknown function (DUF559)/Domain of unknown function (DUF4095) [Frankia torreyi]KQC38780.1 hypothetical protein UK82_08320 [Frankia sp. ACN1ag]
MVQAYEKYEKVVELARRQDDVVTREQARQLGMSHGAIALRRSQHGWTSPIRGALVVPPVRDELRAHARALVAVGGGTICGLTAARLHGLPGLLLRRPEEPVDVALPGADGYRQRRGYRRHRMTLGDSEAVDLAGLRVSSVPRTLEDLALLCEREVFVCVLDAMLQGRLMTEGDLLGLRGRVEARRHGGRARHWWTLIDGRAESPLETRLRLLLGDAGLLPEELQWPVHDPMTRRLVARLDFAWPSARLAIEADGVGPHGEPEALHRDRSRQNELVRLGWEVLRFTWRDVTVGSRRLTATVTAALRDAARRGGTA